MSKENQEDKALIEAILAIPSEDRITEFKRLGEGDRVEKIIESVVAMSNTDGGYLILGVDDPEKTKLKVLDRVYGIEENLEKYDEIKRNIDRIRPPVSIVWPPITLKCDNTKTIALIKIAKATENFHSIDNHVFIRLEKGNVLLSPHEVVKYSYAKGFQKADRELVEVDFDLLKTEYYERWRRAKKMKRLILKRFFLIQGWPEKMKKMFCCPRERQFYFLLFIRTTSWILNPLFVFFNTKEQLKQLKKQ